MNLNQRITTGPSNELETQISIKIKQATRASTDWDLADETSINRTASMEVLGQNGGISASFGMISTSSHCYVLELFRTGLQLRFHSFLELKYLLFLTFLHLLLFSVSSLFFFVCVREGDGVSRLVDVFELLVRWRWRVMGGVRGGDAVMLACCGGHGGGGGK